MRLRQTDSSSKNKTDNCTPALDKMVKRKVAALEKVEADLVNLQYKIRRDPRYALPSIPLRLRLPLPPLHLYPSVRATPCSLQCLSV